jgi:hypothetical protein
MKCQQSLCEVKTRLGVGEAGGLSIFRGVW